MKSAAEFRAELSTLYLDDCKKLRDLAIEMVRNIEEREVMAERALQRLTEILRKAKKLR